MLKQVALAAGLIVGLAASANAAPIAPTALEIPGMTHEVRDGCGPGWFRGPGGACHPMYKWGWGRSCPPGYWRGPWGHCRNTPYHGRLPGGGWR